MSHCSCSTCRNPDGDVTVKATHAERHRAYDALVAERPDPHGFTPPTPAQMVTLVSQEWHVNCTMPAHVGAPRHPGAHT